MDFSIEKYISNFVQSQFPSFYRDEAENFTLFVKAYYEWMESQGQPVLEARNLLHYRDIDDTLEKFLEFFQKKYLYGIPFNVISNKRFLLKHILDVYRSKGTIQCYRLLFKLIYDEDVKVYLPSNDYLRASDGTWEEPRYLEITPSSKNNSLLGHIIVGVTSKTTAVIENYVKESYDNDTIDILYISNVLPKGGQFLIGEKIIPQSENNGKINLFDYPTLLGSLDRIEILNGGQGFRIGDLLKIKHTDENTNEKLSHGINGIVKVNGLGRAEGQMNFDILSGGYGYTLDSKILFYPNLLDQGFDASFKIFGLGDTQDITYNTDIVCDYLDIDFNASTYGLPGNTSANASSVLDSNTFQYTTKTFGSLASLTEIRTGQDYEYPANVFIRSVLLSNNLPGDVSYTTSCTVVTGTSTEFTKFFHNNDVVYIQANNLISTGEYVSIRTVNSDTSLTLYAKPKFNSSVSATFRAAPTILPANFAVYQGFMKTANNSIVGENEQVVASPSFGSDIVGQTKCFDSGKGYTDGELVSLYRYGSLSNFTVVNAGQNYNNNDLVIISGGGENFISPAKLNIVTNNSGNITSISVSYNGAGYTKIPDISIKSETGTGGLVSVKLKEYDESSEVTGKIVKTSIGKAPGSWTTTRGFLNSDKYIHDSYYYQDYSYEIRVPLTLKNYKEILYSTFHPSGSELFGKYSLDYDVSKPFGALYDNDYAFTVQITDEFYSLTADTDVTKSGVQTLTVDMYDAFTVIANTSYVDAFADVIKINNSSNTFGLSDYVYYQVESGDTAIGGLTANSYYYVSYANSSYIGLADTLGGNILNLTESRTDDPGESHAIYVVEKAE